MLIANDFNHPQSKKCFTKASHIISRITKAVMPLKKAPKSVLIKVPRTTIQIASVNFAFSFPTSALPESQRTGETMIALRMMLMTNLSKLITKFLSPLSTPK